MKLRHFRALSPLCAVCQKEGAAAQLQLHRVLRSVGDGDDGDVLEGMLLCPRCGREYPVIDGVPILVATLRAYLSQSVLHVLMREDLPEEIESLLGDACGPGSPYVETRHHLSSYVHGHYGDLDPEERPRPERPPLLSILDVGLRVAQDPMLQPLPPGPVLDAGCSVGRTSFALAEALPGRLVLGADLNFSMLRLASRALRAGEISYPRRRVGLVYDRRRVPVELPGADADNIDFWACDAQAPPFAPRTFALASSLNLLDCVTSPWEHLAALGQALQVGGRAVIATPYDWSPGATPVEGWIGGHSQRGPEEGRSEVALRALLSPGQHPAATVGLRLVGEVEDLPWPVRVHDRGTMHYSVHLTVAEATG